MIRYAEFRGLHKNQTLSEFLVEVTEPHLLAPVDVGLKGGARAHWSGATTSLRVVGATRQRTVSRELGLIPLRKRAEGSPFADMITIGRASNNDVVFAHPCVSWFHAYLRWRGERWIIDDAGSSNGTRVDGEEAPPARSLASGSVVELGGAVLVEFLEPAEIYARLYSN